MEQMDTSESVPLLLWSGVSDSKFELRLGGSSIYSGLQVADEHGSIYRYCPPILEIVPLRLLGKEEFLQEEKAIPSKGRQFPGFPTRFQRCEHISTRESLARSSEYTL